MTAPDAPKPLGTRCHHPSCQMAGACCYEPSDPDAPKCTCPISRQFIVSDCPVHGAPKRCRECYCGGGLHLQWCTQKPDPDAPKPEPQGTFACPICRRDTPHNHSEADKAAWRKEEIEDNAALMPKPGPPERDWVELAADAVRKVTCGDMLLVDWLRANVVRASAYEKLAECYVVALQDNARLRAEVEAVRGTDAAHELVSLRAELTNAKAAHMAAVGVAQGCYTELENDMKAHLRAAQGEIDALIAQPAPKSAEKSRG